jgi:hypothetical protein
MSITQAYSYYNMYLTCSVYFRYAITELTNKQEKILIKIYEKIILKKLGLRKYSLGTYSTCKDLHSV